MLNNSYSRDFFFADDLISFIDMYRGKIFVIKYGGAAMQNSNLQSQVIKNIAFLYYLGIKIVLIHGGGPFINSWLSKLNIEPKFDHGIRVTDSKTMEIVEMVLSGKINKELVNLLNINNIPSVGLSGKDSNLIVAAPLFPDTNNLVGKVTDINNDILKLLLNNNYIPVISSIASDLNCQTYNINADIFASFIATSLLAEKLILLTDTLGVMLDIEDSSTLIKKLHLHDVQKLKTDRIISGGMIPKVDCCVDAIQLGVNSTHIINGQIKNALLYETLTKDRIGSMIIL